MYRHVVECFKSSQSQLELMSTILITEVYLGILVTKISNEFKMTKSKNTVDIIDKHESRRVWVQGGACCGSFYGSLQSV